MKENMIIDIVFNGAQPGVGRVKVTKMRLK